MFINVFLEAHCSNIYMSNQRFYCKLVTLALIMLLITYSGDIETNPGPKKNTKISFCHWNLNRIAAHNFSKVSLLQAMATTHEFNIICLSETFFDSLFNLLDDEINVEGNNLLKADHLMIIRAEELVCILKNTFQFQDLMICVIYQC